MRVKIIRRKGHVALVAWVEGPSGLPTGERPRYRRAVLPVAEMVEIQGDAATHADPDVGIAYGADWEDLLLEGGMPVAAADFVANELRRLDIWTYADLQARPQDVLNAFREVYAMDAQRLREAARVHYASASAR